ncbi:MAG: ABC transporter permease [Clostridiales Family XIII bacterium]|jgi:ribose transport system permease protein|nr:ABC transporter permease [Clostridiales Family XIII bacterium]
MSTGFLAEGNIRGIFLSIVVQGMMLIGLTCLIIGGEIDLSVGAQATVSAMLFAELCQSAPQLPWGVNVAICMALGVGIGLIYSFLVNVLKFMSFIATIGTSAVLSGLAMVWTNANIISIRQASFNAMGKIAFFGRLPLLFLFMMAILIVFAYIMSNTPYGRSIYMLGGNRTAARLAGLNPDHIRIKLFVQNSVLACVAGIFWASQMKLASPSAIVAALPDLSAITAAILGGVAFMGGKGNLAGAFAGMLLLNVFENMLNVLRVQPYWNIFAQGALLIAALVFDHISAEQHKRTLLKESMLDRLLT